MTNHQKGTCVSRTHCARKCMLPEPHFALSDLTSPFSLFCICFQLFRGYFTPFRRAAIRMQSVLHNLFAAFTPAFIFLWFVKAKAEAYQLYHCQASQIILYTFNWAHSIYVYTPYFLLHYFLWKFQEANTQSGNAGYMRMTPCFLASQQRTVCPCIVPL